MSDSRNSDAGSDTRVQSTGKSSTLMASIKSSLIAKVNHATAVRRQRSAADPCVSDISSSTTTTMTRVDGFADESAIGRRLSDGRGSAAVKDGVPPRRRFRSPFGSSSRLSSSECAAAGKPSCRSSLAAERIIESVVFRPSASSSPAGCWAARQSRDGGVDGLTAETGVGGRRRSVDVATGVDASSDSVVERQGVAAVRRSPSQGNTEQYPAALMPFTSTLVRSVSTSNTRESLLPSFVNANFNQLP